MTTYNTRNKLGSTAVKDLYDNAENLDTLVNDKTKEAHPDRFGVPRKTWHGMEQDFQRFLLNSGYEHIGDYGAGLNITAHNQVFAKDGELYRASASLELPYTTGDWTADGDLFVSAGDGVLRQDLSKENGASMVGSGNGRTVADDLQSFSDNLQDLSNEDSEYLVSGIPARLLKAERDLSLMDSGGSAVDLLARIVRPEKMYIRFDRTTRLLTVSVVSQQLEPTNIPNACTHYVLKEDGDGVFDMHYIDVGKADPSNPGEMLDPVRVMSNSVFVFAISSKSVNSNAATQWVPAHSVTGVTNTLSVKAYYSGITTNGSTIEYIPETFTEVNNLHVHQYYTAHDVNYDNQIMWEGHLLHKFEPSGWTLNHKLDFKQDVIISSAYLAMFPGRNTTFKRAKFYGTRDGVHDLNLNGESSETRGSSAKNAIFFDAEWAAGRPVYMAMTVDNIRNVLNSDRSYAARPADSGLITDREDGVSKMYWIGARSGSVIPNGEVWKSSFSVLAGIGAYPAGRDGLF